MRRWLPYAISFALHLTLALIVYQVQSTLVPYEYEHLEHQIVMPRIGLVYAPLQNNDHVEAEISEINDNPFETPDFDGPQNIHHLQMAQVIPQVTHAPKNVDTKPKAEPLANDPTLSDERPKDTPLLPQNDIVLDAASDTPTRLASPDIAPNDAAKAAKLSDAKTTQNQDLQASKGTTTNAKADVSKTNTLNPNSSGDDDRLWEAYVKTLNRHFSAKKFYPDMARKLGHRGTVWVSLKISRSGGLLNAQIETSSGSALLDRAALEAAQMAMPAPPFPAKTLESDRIVRIPYRYL